MGKECVFKMVREIRGDLLMFQAMFIEMLSGVLLLVAILGGAALMYNYLEKGDSNDKK
ncbi:hypothetical protein FV3_00123 [Escherichia phage FV3]|jgi:hypothetical protein|uniref:Uncharacterized protein n=4 Tax=Vequintavirus TaxID=1914852 RepID=H6W844_9CAUD|nr:hypothetical protein FV3_00123 [Escherichia phage FV3]AEZ65259.1 hypothetical protein FV3_00123 [Escherichia phage FV3]